MAGRLEGRIAVVTGAASGIGRASAQRFLAEGARVVAGDIDAAGLANLTDELGTERLRGVEADVTERVGCDRLVDAAVESFGALDVFFANAGGAAPQALVETAPEAFRQTLALNLESVWHGAQAALRVMLPRRSGCFLATSSGAGLNAVAGLSTYGAAKAGVQALVKSLALEHGRDGIRACAIAPGPMATPGLLAYVDAIPGGRTAFTSRLPMRRLGLPEEIASAAVFLASDDAAYISGATLPVDGALHAELSQPQLGD
jgi:meso-butanediol dehydrogenase/(S,S)-butanediol dehydrogenase/diacetyl reductase